jgi:molecular chaperone DnaJ
LPTDRDYYEILGVSKDSSTDESRKRFRKLAMEYHPDRNPGDEEAEEKFKEAAEAYDVLSNDDKRARYDRFGKAGLGAMPQFSNFQDIFSHFGDIFGGDVFGGGIFGDIFGGGGGSRAGGTSLRCQIDISFEEAARGTTKTIRLKRAEPCERCRGTGAKDGTEFRSCPTCRGTGSVTQSTGFFTMRTGCPSCRGQGRVIKEKCSTCRGSGRVAEKVEVKVDVPAGIEDGTRIRLAGQGEPDLPGGPRGDLYCRVSVEPHKFFQREGDHLVCEVPITYAQAALGAEVRVPTLDGTAKVTIPHGTQSGTVFRLRAQGMPNVRTGRAGDLLAVVAIEVPKKLTEKEEELLRKLAEVERTAVSPKRRGFLDWLKEQFLPEDEDESKDGKGARKKSREKSGKKA